MSGGRRARNGAPDKALWGPRLTSAPAMSAFGLSGYGLDGRRRCKRPHALIGEPAAAVLESEICSCDNSVYSGIGVECCLWQHRTKAVFATAETKFVQVFAIDVSAYGDNLCSVDDDVDADDVVIVGDAAPACQNAVAIFVDVAVYLSSHQPFILCASRRHEHTNVCIAISVARYSAKVEDRVV